MAKVLALASKAATPAHSDGWPGRRTRRASTIAAIADTPDSSTAIPPGATWPEGIAQRSRSRAPAGLVGWAPWRGTAHRPGFAALFPRPRTRARSRYSAHEYENEHEYEEESMSSTRKFAFRHGSSLHFTVQVFPG